MNLETSKEIVMRGEVPFTMPVSTVAQRPAAPVRIRPAPLPPIAKAVLPVQQDAIARRYCDEILTPELVAKVEASLELLAKEQKVIEQHNVPMAVERVNAAKRAYEADPSPANLQKFRAEKSLDTWDHGSIQLAAMQRKGVIVLREIAPLMPAILLKLADLLEADSRLIEVHDGGHFANFALPAPTHGLVQSLRSSASNYRRQAEYGGRSPEFPELLNYLLAAHRDPDRKPANLTPTKLYMPKPVEAGEVGAVEIETAEPGDPAAN
ncbi:MAG: hypothetical protein WAO02_14820 [Verrucomicrobiia bacterium]